MTTLPIRNQDPTYASVMEVSLLAQTCDLLDTKWKGLELRVTTMSDFEHFATDLAAPSCLESNPQKECNVREFLAYQLPWCHRKLAYISQYATQPQNGSHFPPDQFSVLTT